MIPQDRTAKAEGTERLFLCIAEAVAGTAHDFRPGARHTMVIIIGGTDEIDAQARAIAFAERCGWICPQIGHTELLDAEADIMKHDTLQDAVEVAKLRGHCVAIDLEEIPLDS